MFRITTLSLAALLLVVPPCAARAETVARGPEGLADPALSGVMAYQLPAATPQVAEAQAMPTDPQGTPGEAPAPLADPAPYRFGTLAKQSGAVKWEVAGLTAAITATRFKDVTKGGSGFHYKNEGWFGRNTYSLGMDKMHHSWKTYVFTDVLQSIIENRTGDKKGAAYTSTVLALGVMTYAELMDGFTKRTGFSSQDMAVHFAGAGLSLARNTIPGMREKVDFRMEMSSTFRGEDLRLVDQLAKRKYLLAAQLSGFKGMERNPLRFAELHFGYYGRGFSAAEKARGEPIKRRLFFGVGFNVQQLFSAKPKSRVEALAKGAFDYVQLPYTSINR